MLYQTKNIHGGDIYGGNVSLDYSANTNPFGTPQGVLAAVTNCLQDLHRYPDPYCRKLVQAIAEFERVPATAVLCGNGAAELINSYCEALQPRTAVELAPTFLEYALGLTRVGCEIQRYSLNQETDFTLTTDFLPFLWETKPDVVFLCTPNNPTGKLIPVELLKEILEVCEKNNTHLFLDECFLDLSSGGESMKCFLEEHPSLFLLKAFTKSYGMAGIRLGYCLCADTELLGKMARTVQPWNVSSIAQAAGIAALQEGDFLKQTRTLIETERPWLKAQLEGLGLHVCDSKANFLLFQGPETLHERLMCRGIAIRNCDNYFGLGAGWYRIAVRQHSENRELIEAISLEVSVWQKTL